MHVGRIRGRIERVVEVVAESQCRGRSALVARAQRDRGDAQTGRARLQDETERNTRRTGQRAQLLYLLAAANEYRVETIETFYAVS